MSAGFFPALLTLSVYGFAISLLFWRGTYKPFLYLAAFAVLGLTVKDRGWPRWERPFLVLLGLVLILVAQGWVLAGSKITGNFHVFLLWTVLMVYAITRLPERLGGRFRLTHGALAAALLAVSVPVHIAAYLLGADAAEADLMAELDRVFQSNPSGIPSDPAGRARFVEIARAAVLANVAGLFPNIHLLALYAVMTLPVLFHFSIQGRGALRWVFVLALAGDFWLLLKTQSRPGFLALLAGSLAVVPLLSRRHGSIALAAAVLVPAFLYATGIFGFAARIGELVDHFAQEERQAMWRETLALLRTNSAPEWLFGHGFGQFLPDYKPYSSFHSKQDFSFPHNFVLELLYSHGLLGLALVAGAYLALYGALLKSLRESPDRARARFGVVLISILTAHGVHAFLTLPIFSRPVLYPLSLVLGASLWYLRPPALGYGYSERA